MENSNKRVAVYIDGSNLYHKLKSLEIKNTLDFDYRAFSEYLARERKIESCRYYIGAVRALPGDEKANRLRKEQQRLFSNLEKQNFTIKRGYLMENGGKYHEKGVDVNMAVDILVGAFKNFYDTAILVSSDTDLIPAIRYAKSLKKEIEYIGFSHCPSFGLQKNVTLSRLLLKEELEPFILKELL